EKLTAALSVMVSDEQLSPQVSCGVAGNEERPAAGKSPESPPRGEEKEGDAIAIVGVACRLPGGVVSAVSFLKLLDGGRRGIVSMPSGRWRWPALIDLDAKHRGIDKAGFLERIDEFDASFFRVSPKEAELMDPQQRLLLELSWEAMEDAGHRPSEI